MQEEGIDPRMDEREQSSEDDATPSASFIETTNPARNPQTTENQQSLDGKCTP